MSEVNDLSFIMDDGVLGEPYTIQRATGTFVLGGWQIDSVNIPGYGVVSVANDQDMLQIPEGDRITGAMVFHSTKRIYETQLDSNPSYGQGPFGGTTQWFSDIMIWNYQSYRIMKVGPYPNRSYWRGIGVRMAGV